MSKLLVIVQINNGKITIFNTVEQTKWYMKNEKTKKQKNEKQNIISTNNFDHSWAKWKTLKFKICKLFSMYHVILQLFIVVLLNMSVRIAQLTTFIDP